MERKSEVKIVCSPGSVMSGQPVLSGGCGRPYHSVTCPLAAREDDSVA